MIHIAAAEIKLIMDMMIYIRNPDALSSLGEGRWRPLSPVHVEASAPVALSRLSSPFVWTWEPLLRQPFYVRLCESR